MNGGRARFLHPRVLAALIALAAVTPGAQAPASDLLIKNGRIVDGIGSPWYRGDVAVRGDTTSASAHPRSYGTFVRVLGRYVRELKVITLEDDRGSARPHPLRSGEEALIGLAHMPANGTCDTIIPSVEFRAVLLLSVTSRS